MRVGLFLPTRPPEQGGAFTFERNFFDSLVECASESSHQFVVFGRKEDRQIHFPSAKFESVILSHILYLTIKSRVRLLLNSFLRRICLVPGILRNEDWLDESLKKNRIDVFLNLTPAIYTKAVPYITVLWDLQHRLQPYFPEISLGGRWERWEEKFAVLLRRASFVITGTNVGKQEIEFLYQVPAQRIKVLPLPTPQFALSASAVRDRTVLSKYELPENFLFYPAQFWPHKNHASLLLALKKIQEGGLDLSLVLVGKDHGNGPYIRQLAGKLGLERKVHFLGFVTRDELIALYQHAFALVCLSLFGPDNTPPLEAFALGCPVIANNWSGAEEQLGSAALLVRGTDIDDVANAVNKLYYDPALRKEYIDRGYIRARQFVGKDFVRGLFSILDEFEPLRRCWGEQRDYESAYNVRHLVSRLKIPF